MVSTKGRYALRVMIELAVRRDEGVVCLKEIAEHQQISEKYLEAIVKSLVSAGLVIGTRVKGGGYRLSCTPEECTVADILRAAEGSLSPVNCRDDDCPRHGNCATLPMWEGLERVICNYLDGITLQDLLEQQTARAANDYVI